MNKEVKSGDIWVKNFKKNLANNRQLSFISNMSISAVSSKNMEECEMDMLKLRQIKTIPGRSRERLLNEGEERIRVEDKTKEVNENTDQTDTSHHEDSVFLFDCDLRSQFIQNIEGSKKCKIIVFFPLSREKFKIEGTFQILTHTSEGEASDLEGIRTKVWDSLEKEEKNSYREWNPDNPKTVTDQLNTFNNPSTQMVSSHFGILVITPSRSKFRLQKLNTQYTHYLK